MVDKNLASTAEGIPYNDCPLFLNEASVYKKERPSHLELNTLEHITLYSSIWEKRQKRSQLAWIYGDLANAISCSCSTSHN